MYTLSIYTPNAELRALYQERKNFSTDAGVDLYIPHEVCIDGYQTALVDLEIKCKLEDAAGVEHGYLLYSRSSIVKTPLLLANGVGVVDIGYRNTVKAALRNVAFDGSNASYTIAKHSRLVQIVAADMKPITVKIVEEDFETTSRGLGGFGSTGV